MSKNVEIDNNLLGFMNSEVIAMKTILCKSDYKELVNAIIKVGNEANNAYELIGECVSIPLASSDTVASIFDISDSFIKEFSEALHSIGHKEKIGPYIMDKYIFIIPAIKSAIKRFLDDCDETRRCIVKFPHEHCFQSVQFLLRENTVNVVCYMRSCDAIKNLPHDAWLCSYMADILAESLNKCYNITPYKNHRVTMMFGSLHVYKEDVK